MSSVFADLQAESERQKQTIHQKPIINTPKQSKSQSSTSKSTRKVTLQPTQKNTSVREVSSDKPREKSRHLPTRDEIQEFSFRLRDELKVKVQAEVPHHWQGKLETIARDLNVKKLELYRYIIGDFLGEVSRHSSGDNKS